MGGSEITVSKGFPSYLQIWRHPDPLSPCSFRTHFINWLCQQVLLIPRNGVRGGFWCPCLFGGSWLLVHCGNWMVDSGWWLCFSWGYLVSWLNTFEWPLECSAEAGGLAKDSSASHSCSCLCKVFWAQMAGRRVNSRPVWNHGDMGQDMGDVVQNFCPIINNFVTIINHNYINGGMACQDSQEKVIG